MATPSVTVKNAIGNEHEDHEQMLPDFLSKEEIALLKRTMLARFPEDEQESFIRVCQRTRLDPFIKQIYPTRRYQKVKDENGETKKVPTLVTVTGIMGLCAIAERTGNYDGCEISWSGKDGNWKSEWLSDETPEAARCVVYHKKRSHPEVGIARWNSYVGQVYNYQTKQWEITDFWAKMPDYMLSKCSKAQALRGAFPDQLSNIYIREELDSDLTDSEHTETISADEQKIMENRKREEEIKASGKFQVVEQVPAPKPPTPEQMAEPIEPHKPPPKPATPPPVVKPEVPQSPFPEAEKAPAISTETEVAAGGLGPNSQPPPPWREHVVLGVTHPKFHNRKIGELNQAELQVIENQWLPAVRENWDDATDAQRADARAFESAIAFYKMQKPW